MASAIVEKRKSPAYYLIAVAAVITWQVAGLDDDMVKAAPGFAAAALVYAVYYAAKGRHA